MPQVLDGGDPSEPPKAAHRPKRTFRLLPLVGSAQRDIERAERDFAKDLLNAARKEARADKVDAVSAVHVRRALTMLRRRTHIDRVRQAAGIVGAIMLGAAGPSFLNVVFGDAGSIPPSTLSGMTVSLVVGLTLTYFSLRDIP